MSAAGRIFGSWNCALQSAGIDPKEVRIYPFHWGKRSIGRVIRALRAANVSLKEKNFKKDENPKISTIIYCITGRTTRGRWLHQVARWKFGSWSKAVEYALSSSFKEDASDDARAEAKETVALYIRRLHEQGFEMNYRSMVDRSKQIQAFNQGAFGEKISGLSLISAATKYMGSWDEALEAAQLDPLEIRKRMRSHTSNRSVTPSQVERVSVGKNEVRNVTFLGDAPKAPDEILEHSELVETLRTAIEDLDEEDQEVAEDIFDIVLQVRRFEDQTELVKIVVQLSNGALSEFRVRNVLKTLAQNAALRR